MGACFLSSGNPEQISNISHGGTGIMQEGSSTYQPFQNNKISIGTAGMARENFKEEISHSENMSHRTVSYPEKERDDLYGSFAGLVFHQNSIIAFCDSKRTKYDINNNPYKEEERTVHRLIKGSDYIGVIYGNRANCGPYSKEIPIEDWIRENMPCPYDDLMKELHVFLLKEDRSIERSIPFCFYFGEKYGVRNKAVRYEISDSIFKKHVSYPFNETLVWGGNSEYGNYYDFFPGRLLSSDTEEIKKELESCIEWRDKFSGKYNPVGGKVFVEEYICKS